MSVLGIYIVMSLAYAIMHLSYLHSHGLGTSTYVHSYEMDMCTYLRSYMSHANALTLF